MDIPPFPKDNEVIKHYSFTANGYWVAASLAIFLIPWIVGILDIFNFLMKLKEGVF